MQQQPDQGCLLISWHELATNPITQSPRRSPHPFPGSTKQEPEHIAGMSAELSLKSNIFSRTHGLEAGMGAGGRACWKHFAPLRDSDT